ncbi:MAG: glycosyltransferase, partial [Gammaproteobacteria bacterium]|nr:glycosyltransferase [Gammaproteobacteria bacterium]
MIRVFIGYDPREAVAYSVLTHSILSRATVPVSVAPLMLSELQGILTRERHPLQSTDFAFSRFLTPYLAGFEGWSVFMDCDMLVLDDIANLWKLRDERYAVMVVKHEHKPRETVKFLDQPQTEYPKKNWSSV